MDLNTFLGQFFVESGSDNDYIYYDIKDKMEAELNGADVACVSVARDLTAFHIHSEEYGTRKTTENGIVTMSVFEVTRKRIQ